MIKKIAWVLWKKNFYDRSFSHEHIPNTASLGVHTKNEKKTLVL